MFDPNVPASPGAILVGRRAPLRLSRSLSGAALVGVALAAPSLAQQESFLVSTSSNVASTTSLAAIDDATLVLVDGFETRLQFAEEHWQAVWGSVPGDVDGLARRPGFAPGSHRSLAFSLQSDEGGFQDGDVLALAPGGGFEVVIPESDVQVSLGTSSTIDLDGLAFDDQGRLLFTLQSNLTSSAIGPVDDGDVLRLEPGGTVTRVMTEAEVQAAVELATGSGSAIGDVLALDVVGGELWVGVQSPSASDGALVRLGATPAVMLDEAAVGLGGAELDAFVRIDPAARLGRLDFSVSAANPGDVFDAEFTGGMPGHPLLVLVAGNGGYLDTTGSLAGFDAVYVDLNDPWLTGHVPLPVVTLDGSGSWSATLQLPPGNFGGVGLDGEAGWTFQTIDLFSLEVAAPCRLAL